MWGGGGRHALSQDKTSAPVSFELPLGSESVSQCSGIIRQELQLHFLCDIVPDSVEKHLKLLSQYPEAMMCRLELVTTKHEDEGVTVWSRGSPSWRRARPEGVPDGGKG